MRSGSASVKSSSPMGILWASLSKSGIGLQGTAMPRTIGLAESAGCVRFANWDAIRLPTLVRPGSQVIVREAEKVGRDVPSPPCWAKGIRQSIGANEALRPAERGAVGHSALPTHIESYSSPK